MDNDHVSPPHEGDPQKQSDTFVTLLLNHNDPYDPSIIRHTNYWKTPLEKRGYICVSFAHNVFRILVPRSIQKSLLD